MRHASRSLCFLVLLWLSGCATQKIVATRSASDVHDWQASGRIAVSGASSGGSGSFNWVQRGTEANVQMHGPIGVGHLQLLVSDHSLRI
ncbi:MAG TPA: lipoprotein insertase outer membrane protein LolB, partial [Steroidobacteraceae bacterium]|nr:lipoprotein insertase outer membrane protein LolB [Steroidobacteraceae bacterium]